MQKRTLLFVSVMMFLGQMTVFSQEELYAAPVNPALKNYAEGKTHDRGVIPSSRMGAENNVAASRQLQSPLSLPSRYDMRDSGWVTSVKDQLSQGPCGSCWTHSCMANLEALCLRQDGQYYDLSEDNLNNCHAPFDFLHCKGGNFSMSSAYLLRGSGPLSELQDPYTGPNDSTCPSAQLQPMRYITDAWDIPTNDPNVIKQAIIDYGSLDVSFYFSFDAIRTADSTFFFTKKYTFSTANTDTSGFGQWHEVSLIGWDDNKPTAASLPGAWIIKNSIVKSFYGDTTQSAGILYVSYYDSVAWQNIGCWPKKIQYDTAAVFHRYDEAGWVQSFGYNNGAANYGIVKFDANNFEQVKMLTAVAANPNTTLSFDMYSNFNGTTLSGPLGSIPAQVCTFSGFHSFNLPTPISISQGNSFYVKVTFSCPSNPQYLLPIESAYPGYTTSAAIETGKCWISGNGTSWTAIGANTPYKYDLCVKAYATASAAVSVNEINHTIINKVAPNPASTRLNLEFSDNAEKILILTNPQGQVILTRTVNGASANMDVSDLAAGVYFITVKSENKVHTVKFIRQD